MFLRITVVVALTALVACKRQIGQSDERVGPPAVDPVLAIESGARRLSQSELDNTLRDLVGEDSAPAARLLNEDEYRPFDNDYTIQQASEALITSLEALAEQVAQATVADTARRDNLVPCTPASAGDEACFRTFLEDFLPRALRRAATPDDIDAYMPLLAFASHWVPARSKSTAVRWMSISRVAHSRSWSARPLTRPRAWVDTISTQRSTAAVLPVRPAHFVTGLRERSSRSIRTFGARSSEVAS